MNLARAIALASKGFEDRLDKSGEPYILHCIRVMMNLNTNDEVLQTIAILHDCVEDKVCDLDDLRDMGFSYRVRAAVDLLTHKSSDTYDEYIKKLSYNEDARLVKLADLKDNSQITRLKGLTKKDFNRMEKYHRAYTYLSKT